MNGPANPIYRSNAALTAPVFESLSKSRRKKLLDNRSSRRRFHASNVVSHECLEERGYFGRIDGMKKGAESPSY
jgi:hypothetical protein